MSKLFKFLNSVDYIQIEVTAEDGIPEKIRAFTVYNVLKRLMFNE